MLKWCEIDLQFCSSVYTLTIINLYVHLLPVTEGEQNNKKK